MPFWSNNRRKKRIDINLLINNNDYQFCIFNNKKNKEQRSILKNNIARTKSRFNFSLFLTKGQKFIDIYDKKIEKKLLKRLNEIYNEQNSLTNQYHEWLDEQNKNIGKFEDNFYEKQKTKFKQLFS